MMQCCRKQHRLRFWIQSVSSLVRSVEEQVAAESSGAVTQSLFQITEHLLARRFTKPLLSIIQPSKRLDPTEGKNKNPDIFKSVSVQSTYIYEIHFSAVVAWTSQMKKRLTFVI